MLLFLCTCWLPTPSPAYEQEIQVLELFSGRARLCRLARSLGMTSQAHDISYDRSEERSSMDVNESAGFMLLSRNLFCAFHGELP